MKQWRWHYMYTQLFQMTALLLEQIGHLLSHASIQHWHVNDFFKLITLSPWIPSPLLCCCKLYQVPLITDVSRGGFGLNHSHTLHTHCGRRPVWSMHLLLWLRPLESPPLQSPHTHTLHRQCMQCTRMCVLCVYGCCFSGCVTGRYNGVTLYGLPYVILGSLTGHIYQKHFLTGHQSSCFLKCPTHTMVRDVTAALKYLLAL